MSTCIGRIIDGKYVIRESLERGGAHEVYLADHVTLGCEVEVKVLRAGASDVREEVERFLREATTCAQIVSDHVVKVLDLGRVPSGELFIVTERLIGETLAQRLGRGVRLFPSEIADLGVQVLAALDATHEAGVVHRNVAPQNIFYAVRHEAERVKLLDFGVCRLMASSAKYATVPAAMFNATAYMAPEHVRGEPVDTRADLYSLGVVLHEAAVGRLPHDATSELFDPGLGAIVARATAPRRDDRFQDAAAMRDALLTWYANADAAAPSTLSGVRRRADSKSRFAAVRSGS